MMIHWSCTRPLELSESSQMESWRSIPRFLALNWALLVWVSEASAISISETSCPACACAMRTARMHRALQAGKMRWFNKPLCRVEFGSAATIITLPVVEKRCAHVDKPHYFFTLSNNLNKTSCSKHWKVAVMAPSQSQCIPISVISRSQSELEDLAHVPWVQLKHQLHENELDYED